MDNVQDLKIKRNQVGVYTIAELAELYGVTPRTVRTRLKPHWGIIGEKTSWYLTPRQVKKIFECLGEPNNE